MAEKREITLTVNGRQYTKPVQPRKLLLDFIRQDLGLTGTHVGCEHGACGACTILLNGQAVRSCLMLAVQADGCEIRTVEGLAKPDGSLSPLQEAFWDCHAMQCGYCTPGMLMAASELLAENPHPEEEEIREALSGNICRCTGYEQIVRAVRLASERPGVAR